MFAMAERENIAFDLKRCGILHFYRDKAGFEKASEVNALFIEGGLEQRPVTPEEIRQIEPTLKGSYYGGFFTPSDSTGDIHKFTRGLADACARRGVRFVYDAEVEKIVPKDGGFEVRWLPVAPDDTKAATDLWRPIQIDGVVICAGTWSGRFAAMFGDRLNIKLEIAPEVLSVVLPFLALQPLVENAVRHGLSGKPNGGTITITAENAGAECVIIVEDDGVGMDPSRLTDDLEDAHQSGAHVGLGNVDDRMRSAFGDDFGLVVDTNVGAGMKITLRVPKFRVGIRV